MHFSASPTFWLSTALLTVAFAFGGQSRDNPLSTMVIELLGVCLLAVAVWSGLLSRARRPVWSETALLGAMFLVPLLQLIPLPPDIWISLPGRHEAAESLSLAGIEPGWGPISLDPEATFRCVLWLIPPTALFLAVSDLDATGRFRLAGVILALSIVSLTLGGLQITDQDGGFFASPAGGHTDLPIGFFANRNHQGIAMVVALPFAAAFTAIWGSAAPTRTLAARAMFGALIALMIIGALVTRSRAAFALAGPALIASMAIFWAAAGAKRLRREAVLVIIGVGVALVCAAQFAITAALTRFDTLVEGDARLDFWATTLRASADVAPFGSGLGTFVPFYRLWEPLDQMGPSFINHAHNDYLELWLEIGWLAPLVLLAFLVWFGRASLRAWLGPATPSAALQRAGSVAVVVLLCHSIGDYPLRTQGLACAFAFAAACLVPGRQSAPVATRG